MNSMEAAFGANAQNIGAAFSNAAGRATSIVSQTLTKMNQWASAGWSAIPNKRAIGIGTAVGVGLAVVLSDPPPSLNVSSSSPSPDMGSGSGGRNIPNNVHPMPRAVGNPTAPNLTSTMNRAYGSSGYRVNIAARATRGLDPDALGNQISGAMGGGAQVNIRITDDRRSLTSQSVTDILGEA